MPLAMVDRQLRLRRHHNDQFQIFLGMHPLGNEIRQFTIP